MKQVFLTEAKKFQAPSTATQDNTPSVSPDTRTVTDGPQSFIASQGKVTVEEEVKLYLNVGCEPGDCSPLDFWKAHQSSYPTLARMARAYLAVPAASVASEKSFSLAERILSDDRLSMTSDNCEAVVCLHSWEKLGFVF